MTAVSVVIPAYNAARTVGDAVDSVLGQTWSDLELIVVDDGSTDATAEVAAAYPAPVRCLVKQNEGVSRARNVGIAEAGGEYVALLDADDRWAPEKLERQVELLERSPAVGLCTTGALSVDDRMHPVERIEAGRFPDYCEALLLHSMIAGPVSSIVVRRHLVADVGGFDPAFSQCADWDFMLRMAQATRIAAIDQPLVHYRTGAGRMSGDIGLLERDTFAVLEKFFRSEGSAPYAGKKRRIYSNHWMILAGSYLEAGRRGDAVRCVVRGLRADPSNLRAPSGLPVRRLRRRLGRAPGPDATGRTAA